LLKYGENKFRLLRKLITAFYEIMQFLFFVGPKSGLYRGAKSYLAKHEVDIIIATGEPFVLFKYASKLSSKYKIPWIADYRDPWTQDKSRGNNPIRIFKDKLLERYFLASVSGITTVSEFFLNEITQNVKSNVSLICPNGFDEENINAVQKISQGDSTLSIGFVGTIYSWHPLEIFLKVVADFLTINPDKNIHIYFYGTNLSQLDFDDFTLKYPALQNVVFQVSRMPNEDLLQSLAERNLLLLFNYYSYMGTKIYDYLGIRRKIIFCFTEDEAAAKLKAKYFNITSNIPVNEKLQEELILKTGSGIIVRDSSQLMSVLDNIYTEFETFKKIECFSNGIEEYSRRNQAKKLAELMERVIGQEETM
jgi:glycosyltransferase involved in cell wall biosynthesis